MASRLLQLPACQALRVHFAGALARADQLHTPILGRIVQANPALLMVALGLKDGEQGARSGAWLEGQGHLAGAQGRARSSSSAAKQQLRATVGRRRGASEALEQ